MLKNKTIKNYFYLHLLLFMYSLGSVFSKLASKEDFLSFKFILFYSIVLLNLFLYAILWQQILNRMPLITAYANKSVTVIWGILWGYIFFSEKITIFKIIGSLVIIIGVYLFVSDSKEEKCK